MKNLFLTILSVFICTISFAQNKPQQMDPCEDNLGNPVPGCFLVTDINGKYHEASITSSDCINGDLVNTYSDIQTGDEVYIQVLSGSDFCSVSEVRDTIVGNPIATHIAADGTITIINETITGFVDNGNGTATYTSENGTVTTIPLGWTTITDNGNGSFTAIYPDGDTLTWFETTSTLQVNPDGTFTYTDEDLNSTVVDVCVLQQTIGCVPTVSNNGDFTYTFNDGFGNTTIIDVNEIDFDVVDVTINGSVLYFTSQNGSQVTADICAIVAANCDATLVANMNGTWTHTSNSGTVTVFGPFVQSIINNGDGSFTSNTTDGMQVTWWGAISTLVDNLDGTATYTDESGVMTTFNLGWTTVTVNGDNSLTFNYPDGGFTFWAETVTTISANPSGSYTYINEAAVPFEFGYTLTDVVSNSTTSVALYNLEGTLVGAVPLPVCDPVLVITNDNNVMSPPYQENVSCGDELNFFNGLFVEAGSHVTGLGGNLERFTEIKTNDWDFDLGEQTFITDLKFCGSINIDSDDLLPPSVLSATANDYLVTSIGGNTVSYWNTLIGTPAPPILLSNSADVIALIDGFLSYAITGATAESVTGSCFDAGDPTDFNCLYQIECAEGVIDIYTLEIKHIPTPIAVIGSVTSVPITDRACAITCTSTSPKRNSNGIFAVNNGLMQSSKNSVIIGGSNHIMGSTKNSFIISGGNNKISENQVNLDYTGILGGQDNKMINGFHPNTNNLWQPWLVQIIGNDFNTIKGARYGGIVGASYSKLGVSEWCNIFGGLENYVGDSIALSNQSPQFSQIVGGYRNKIIGGGSAFIGGSIRSEILEAQGSIVGSVDSNIDNTGPGVGFGSSILGGGRLSINQDVASSIIGGENSTMSLTLNSAIIGGEGANMENSENSFIMGGEGIPVLTFAHELTNSKLSGIFAGNDGYITESTASTILGGDTNEIVDLDGAAIIGGQDNYIEGLPGSIPRFDSSGGSSVIIGGSNNSILNPTFGNAAIVGASYSTLTGTQSASIFGTIEGIIEGDWAYNVTMVGGLYHESYYDWEGGTVFLGGQDHDQYGGTNALFLGGYGNYIDGGYNSTILTGEGNQIVGTSFNNSIYSSSSSQIAGHQLYFVNYSPPGGDGTVPWFVSNTDISTYRRGYNNTIIDQGGDISGPTLLLPYGFSGPTLSSTGTIGVPTYTGSFTPSSFYDQIAFDQLMQVISGGSKNTMINSNYSWINAYDGQWNAVDFFTGLVGGEYNFSSDFTEGSLLNSVFHSDYGGIEGGFFVDYIDPKTGNPVQIYYTVQDFQSQLAKIPLGGVANISYLPPIKNEMTHSTSSNISMGVWSKISNSDNSFIKAGSRNSIGNSSDSSIELALGSEINSSTLSGIRRHMNSRIDNSAGSFISGRGFDEIIYDENLWHNNDDPILTWGTLIGKFEEASWSTGNEITNCVGCNIYNMDSNEEISVIDPRGTSFNDISNSASSGINFGLSDPTLFRNGTAVKFSSIKSSIGANIYGYNSIADCIGENENDYTQYSDIIGSRNSYILNSEHSSIMYSNDSRIKIDNILGNNLEDCNRVVDSFGSGNVILGSYNSNIEGWGQSTVFPFDFLPSGKYNNGLLFTYNQSIPYNSNDPDASHRVYIGTLERNGGLQPGVMHDFSVGVDKLFMFNVKESPDIATAAADPNILPGEVFKVPTAQPNIKQLFIKE